MIIPDVNLLLYAHNDRDSHHQRALTWWRETLSNKSVILPWCVCHGFIRLSSSQNVFSNPIAIQDGCALVEYWLALANVDIIYPGPRHLAILAHLAESTGISGRTTTDLVLASLALEYGAELHSHDLFFARVPELKWVDPLAS